MSERTDVERRAVVEKWAPLTAVAAAILWVVAVFSMGSGPDDNATPAQVAAYFEDHTMGNLVGASLFGFGVLAFVLFLGVLRSRMTVADRGDLGSSTYVFGVGLLTAAMLMCIAVPTLSLAILADDSARVLDPSTANTLYAAGDGAFVMSGFAAGLFLIVLAVGALRTHLFAPWLAWFGIVVAIVMLVPPIGWAGLIFGFPIWLVATGVTMALRPASVSLTDGAARVH